MRTKRKSAGPLADEVLVNRVVKLFLTKINTRNRSLAEIKKEIFAEFNIRLKNWEVYECVRIANGEGRIRLFPGAEQDRTKQIIDELGLEEGAVHVVPANQHSTELVAAAAAERTFAAIHELTKKLRRPVGIGLGAGRLTAELCTYLADMLQQTPPLRKINLIAISAGCSANSPQYDPAGFFHFFSDDIVEKRVGLFSQPLIRNKEFENHQKLPIVSKAFAARSLVDIIPTSMGDSNDPHDMLFSFLREAEIPGQTRAFPDWLGNVQYRPFSASGPAIEQENDWRTVTLFELSELQSWVRRWDKKIILAARQCPICGMTKARALKHLLKPEFRLFHELILDTATATELIACADASETESPEDTPLAVDGALHNLTIKGHTLQ